MNFVTFLILVMLLGDLAWWWRGDRWLRKLERAQLWRSLFAIFMFAQLTGLSLVIISRTPIGGLNHLEFTYLLAAVYLWHLPVLMPLLVVWLISSLISGILWLARKLSRQAPREAAAGLSRREFLGASAALVPAALTVGTTTASLPQLQHFRIRPLEISLPELPPALDGLTIAHVTDVHVGRFTHGEVLDQMVEATNALNADLVLMTGDLINFALSDLPAALTFAKNLRAPHGVFMCEGNHDLIEDGEVFRRETKAAGVQLLVNETASLMIRETPVQLLGLRWGGPRHDVAVPPLHGDQAIAASMQELLATRQPGAFPILLAHHPHAFDYAAGIPLTVAGHTHGGQLMLNERTGFGPLLFRYWSGLYQKDGRQLIVSNGAGNWFPLRTAAPAEIIHLTLRRA